MVTYEKAYKRINLNIDFQKCLHASTPRSSASPTVTGAPPVSQLQGRRQSHSYKGAARRVNTNCQFIATKLLFVSQSPI